MDRKNMKVGHLFTLVDLLLLERSTLYETLQQQTKYLESLNITNLEEPEFDEEMGHT